jgi:hypothetical protein
VSDVPTRVESLRGICFCLLYDLCCWLAASGEPVPDDAPEYSLHDLRQVDDPLSRLAAYVSPELTSAWERALEPFFAAGVHFKPELGETAPLRWEGLDGKGPVLAELSFSHRSRGWVLRALLSPDLGRVETASITPA